MMRVGAAPRAEVVLRHAGIEPVNGQRLFAGVERDAGDVGRHCHRAAHPAIRTGATAGGIESVGQFHSEAHGTAVTCRFHFPAFIRVHRQAPEALTFKIEREIYSATSTGLALRSSALGTSARPIYGNMRASRYCRRIAR
jgi:hypothetical protein